MKPESSQNPTLLKSIWTEIENICQQHIFLLFIECLLLADDNRSQSIIWSILIFNSFLTKDFLTLIFQGSKTSSMVERLIMRDFEGLQNCDERTRDAVLDFSYNLSIGNMDEAFRATKTIYRLALRFFWAENYHNCKIRRAVPYYNKFFVLLNGPYSLW